MFGNKIRNVSLDVVNASGFAAFVGFGADDFHLRGLAYVRFGKKVARVNAAGGWPPICVGRRGKIIQSDFVGFLVYTMRGIPNACDSHGAKEENHNEKDQKNFDESAAGFGRSSGRRSGLRRSLRRRLR